MNNKLTFPYPSGKSWTVEDGGHQTMTVNNNTLSYSWAYTCRELVDEDDEKLGCITKSYKGEHRFLHKWYAGTSVSYNTEHKLWGVSVRFSGLESLTFLVRKHSEADKFRDMVEEWDKFNSAKPTE